MHILLINSNRYRFPPVIPLGLEYLAGALEHSDHDCTVLDLCFAADPQKEIHAAIMKVRPDVAGISIRQIDTVLYRNNEFFLDQIKEYVGCCRRHKLKVVLGGSGFSIMPEAVLHYTGADWGVAGPGEQTLPRLLDALKQGRPIERLWDGFDIPTGFSFPRKKSVDYTPYLEKEGVVGFRTQLGCTENCFFCVEGGKKLIFHPPAAVGKELAELKAVGFTDFHLCDSEFNQKLEHCIAVCKAIIRQARGINWSLYMKPEPFSAKLFSLLKESGAESLTLSLDTLSMRAAQHKKRKQAARFFDLAAREDIKVAVDLSVGAPGEDASEVKAAIDFLDEQPVTTVGVNSYYRVYPGTALFDTVRRNHAYKKRLINFTSDNEFVHPVFFNLIPEQKLAEIIDRRSKFRIEGLEMATNYQRVKKHTTPEQDSFQY
ncbi:MAG: cobalamin-dependent protein [Spirochaetales bacterium]|nr:cobalamin-dependent protein [Spirochaetales bacterium]